MRPGRILTNAFTFALFVLTAVTGCSSKDDDKPSCSGLQYPKYSGSGTTIHVAQGCTAEADGSADHPYSTINQALENAPEDAVILVSAGEYKENLRIKKSVHILGSGTDSKAEDAAVIIRAPSPYAVSVQGTVKAELAGLSIQAPDGVGIWALEGSDVTVERSIVDGAINSNEAPYGVGIWATDGATITVQDSQVTNSALIGIIASESRAVIIRNTIKNNAGGGLRIDDSDQDNNIEENEISNNTEFGAAVFSSKAVIIRNTMHGTKMGNVAGDGFIVGVNENSNKESDVNLDSNTIESNARVGVLVDKLSRAVIIRNTLLTNGSTDASVEFGAGVWLQHSPPDGASVQIEANTITDNLYNGIGHTAGARSVIIRNEIHGTLKGVAHIGVAFTEATIGGDGIGIFDGSVVTVKDDNAISGNERSAILADSAGAGTSIENQSGSDLAADANGMIIVQNQTDEVSLDDSSGAQSVQAGDEVPIKADVIGAPPATDNNASL